MFVVHLSASLNKEIPAIAGVWHHRRTVYTSMANTIHACFLEMIVKRKKKMANRRDDASGLILQGIWKEQKSWYSLHTAWKSSGFPYYISLLGIRNMVKFDWVRNMREMLLMNSQRRGHPEKIFIKRRIDLSSKSKLKIEPDIKGLTRLSKGNGPLQNVSSQNGFYLS